MWWLGGQKAQKQGGSTRVGEEAQELERPKTEAREG